MLTTCPVCRVVRSVGNDAGFRGLPCANHPPPLLPYRVRMRKGSPRFEPVTPDAVPPSIRGVVLVLTLLAVLGAFSAAHLPERPPVEVEAEASAFVNAPDEPAAVVSSEPEPRKPVKRKRVVSAAEAGARR